MLIISAFSLSWKISPSPAISSTVIRSGECVLKYAQRYMHSIKYSDTAHSYVSRANFNWERGMENTRLTKKQNYMD